jgi:hypothetical protein
MFIKVSRKNATPGHLRISDFAPFHLRNIRVSERRDTPYPSPSSVVLKNFCESTKISSDDAKRWTMGNFEVSASEVRKSEDALQAGAVATAATAYDYKIGCFSCRIHLLKKVRITVV